MTAGEWESVAPGAWRRRRPAGPSFQWRDPVGFEWNTYRLTVPGWPAALAGFRLVHLSDLHCVANWQTAYDDLLDQLAADVPDLIAVTGDYVEDIFRPAAGWRTARRLLGGLHAKLGVFGVRGNHDKYLDPRRFDRTPLTLIDGQRLLVGGVELIGTPGPMRDDLPARFAAGLPPRLPGVPRVVLAHYPDHLRKLHAVRPDVLLAGHTHGGQLCLPGGLPVRRHDSYTWRLRGGVNRVRRSWLVVSRGIGFSSLPVRLFCPAEVIDLRLYPPEDERDVRQ